MLNLGMAWVSSKQLTLRAGLSLTDNPVQDAMVKPLFSAIFRSHVTLGLGYKASHGSEIDASLTVAPDTTVVNASGVAISHSQTNLQLMFTQRF